jgi:4-alpha-glucanotransferase
MPTFAGFYAGKDIDDRVEQGLLDARGAQQERETREEMRRRLVDFLIAGKYLTTGPTQDVNRVLEAVLAYLASTEAEIVLVNLEDLWSELVPQNVPGVPDRSWRHKLRLGLEEMQADGSIRRVLTNVAARRAACF